MATAPEATADRKSPYRMTVDLAILEHLGINLYSNLAAVLTEVVANAWDADAENVYISHNPNEKEIQIIDDGIGMTIRDMNEQYLRVGYKRREDNHYGRITQKGREVMGRKGLGKLSLFSIANIVEIQSTRNLQKHGLRILVEDIEKAAKSGKHDYPPVALTDNELDIEKGTKILLKDLKRDRFAASALRKRLARRFSIYGATNSFNIYIDGVPITIQDRGDLQKVRFIWTLGGYEVDENATPNIIAKKELEGRLDDWPSDWNIKGWIGTTRYPKDLDDGEAGNLNTIVVFARGRLIHENILDKVIEGGLYTKYLTGQIEADFLDDDDEPDIATSDRQRIKEDDPRYMKLIEFLLIQLKTVEGQWTDLRKKHEVEDIKKEHPAIEEWLNTLRENHKDSAQEMIGKLSALTLPKKSDRNLLYQHGIIAFERMRIRESIDEFVFDIDRVDKLLSLLADRDSLEGALYRDIVKSRLDTIKKFIDLVDENEKERKLQEELFKNLWLLDPTWEHVKGSERMESRLVAEGVFELTEEEKRGRIDITYQNSAGKHIIIELKRAGIKVSLVNLYSQGKRYVGKLRKILATQEEGPSNIEVIFVLGKPLDEETSNPPEIKDLMRAIAPGSRVVYYDSLIKGALDAYEEYLEKNKEFDKIDEIIEKLK